MSFSNKEIRMVHWLQCSVSVGQFTDEYAVEARDFHGRLFSLFVPAEYVEYDDDQSATQPGAGWIRVQVLAEEGNLVLVRLPGTPFENGAAVTVERMQVTLRPEKELA